MMMNAQAQSQSVTLNDDWLSNDTQTNTGTSVSIGGCDNYLGQYYPYFSTAYYPARPIRLTMAEVERLQKAAKADKALRDVLAKFTPQIEVVVEFK